MDTLRIRWNGGESTFEPGTTVRVGRDAGSQIQSNNTNVSRRHVEVTHTPSGWVLRDVGSAQGTWRDGRQIDTVDVRGTIQVTLGREGRGEVLTLEAAAAPPRFAEATELPGQSPVTGPTQIVGMPPPAAASAAGIAGAGTVVVGAATPNRPGGALRADAIAGATVVTGNTLSVECAGQSYTFNPGQDVSIGRDAQCDVVSNNPTVSRRHARITYDGSEWILRDEGSASGTFVGRERITERKLAGSVAAWLGDETTGERLVMVASGTNPDKPKRKSGVMPIVVGVGAVIALIALVGFLVTRGGDDPGPDNNQLARATVFLIAGDFVGSGTIIDAKEGLILTNAHVAEPDAPGAAVRQVKFDDELPPAPKEIVVWVAPGLDQAAEPGFKAKVVAVDGYLDLAVLKITESAGGQLVEPGSPALAKLEEVKIGDSSKVKSGDALRVFGYPVAAESSAVTLTEGVVSSPVKDERIGSNAAMLNITAAISGGNSGGLAANSAGELVGIPSIIRDEKVPSMRPSAFALPLINAARKGEDYESSLYHPLTSEKIADQQLVAPGNAAGISFDCTTGAFAGTDAGGVGLMFNYEGFKAGEHQDLLAVALSGDNEIGSVSLNPDYPLKWASDSGCATVTIPIDVTKITDPTATITFKVGLGPTYKTTA
jgi:pSer/pThr/pTyr-binding forkhead associated (FHA) protein